VKNVEGVMENTTVVRVPDRDQAGTVCHGPTEAARSSAPKARLHCERPASFGVAVGTHAAA